MSYCTPAELRTQIDKTTSTGPGTDAALQVIIDAVCASIDNFCNRPDGFVAPAAASVRYYPGSGKAHQWIDECAAISAVAVKDSSTDEENEYVAWTIGTVGTTLDADVFPATGDPKDPSFNRLPYTFLLTGANGDYSYFPTGANGYPTVKVTARWGYALTVPAAIKQAAIALSARWFSQGKSAWADTLANPELGQLIYRKENADIRFMLEGGRYVRPAIGVRR